jgi:hypothetical protein
MVDWVNMYLDALTDDDLKMEIIPGRNHGVWILGHLIVSDDDLSLYINKQPLLFPKLQNIFKQGSTIQSVEKYPSASELRQYWEEVCEKNDKLFNDLKDEVLDQPHENVLTNTQIVYFKKNRASSY